MTQSATYAPALGVKALTPLYGADNRRNEKEAHHQPIAFRDKSLTNQERNSVMAKYHPLPYLPTMFAACMLFQAVYVLCVALWLIAPDLRGHAWLIDLFPGFELLDGASFFYGLVASAIYGWFAATAFVFFYNLWAGVVRIISGGKAQAK